VTEVLLERAWSSMMHYMRLDFARQLVKRLGGAASRDAALAPPSQLQSLLCWQNNPSHLFVVFSASLSEGNIIVEDGLSQSYQERQKSRQGSGLNNTLYATFSVAYSA
jgi:hypothetical protein